ncbi:DGQHR domain-containing protein [Fodinisporobacter ferrooxydans]|uniref:DGQHR domain-containing protein n=1 Tax=Fodinisporobacter ferrooxydans TaxID=2901836 RepID=A0ABY4CL25_9BACL|nr:DGQHR domain-containing protein [Alicyclobacillaceae bacterium MYW30-H2]
MAKLEGISQIEMIGFKSRNLDTVCFRGHAPLAHLAMISQADIFDQVSNPEGLQRDLSPKHASDAYEYVQKGADPSHPRAFPEVVLNIRNKKVLELEKIEISVEDPTLEIVRLRFDLTKLGSGVAVSRIDGNHRLFYAAGDDRRQPILTHVPFQIHIGLDREKERSLFVDINANQKGLNSSHLAIMQSKLTDEQKEIKDHLERWIANKLASDKDSPWYGLIHLGGSKKGSRTQGLNRIVNLISLQTGVKKLLTKSQYIHDFTDPYAQYRLINMYWHAVKNVFQNEWTKHKDHLILKNIGVLSLSILGGTIIDRCIPRNKVGVQDFEKYLQQAYGRFDWSKEATGDRAITGMSGNQAAMLIAGEMAAELSDEADELTIKQLQNKLLTGSSI